MSSITPKPGMKVEITMQGIEKSRLDAIESAEAQRKADEAERAAAEVMRKDDEAGRITAEQDRALEEYARELAENGRMLAEESRVNAENKRSIGEQSRVDAEDGRSVAEAIRANAEQRRAEAEKLRANAEDARVAAETDRANAEALRQSTFETNEANRQSAFDSAETQRASEWAEIKSDVETSVGSAVASASAATDAANTAADNANAAAEKSVRYDVAQKISDAQKAQARENIEAASEAYVNELKGDLANKVDKTITVISTNRLDLSKVTDNYQLNEATGALYSATGFWVSDFSDIRTSNSSNRIRVSINGHDEYGNCRVVWYDESNKYISGIDKAKGLLDVPVGAKYVRIGSNWGKTIPKTYPYINVGESNLWSEYSITENPQVVSIFENDANYFSLSGSSEKIGIGNVDFKAVGNNLLDNSLIVEGYYIESANGKSYQNAAYSCVLEYIDISENNGYITVLQYNDSYEQLWSFHRGAFYDENKQFISGVDNGSTSGSLPTSVVTVPPNAKYFRCGWTKKANNVMAIYYSDSYVDKEYEPYVLKDANPIALYDRILISEKSNKWIGKRWSAYGDSITDISHGDGLKYGWASYINRDFGFAMFYGRGIGGQTFSYGNNGGSVSFVSASGLVDSRNDAYNKDNYTGAIPAGTVACRSAFCSWDRIVHAFPESIKDTIDLVFVMGGTNDWNSNVDVSTQAEWVESSTVDTEWSQSDYYNGGDFNIKTFRGAIASTIMKMNAWLPNAVIVLASPMSGNGDANGSNQTAFKLNSGGKSMEDYADAVKETAKRFSFPFVDVYGNTMVTIFNRNGKISDGFHPYTTDGKKLLARAVASGISNIYPMY